MSPVLKWTTNAYIIVVGTVALLGFLALQDALHPAGASLLLVLLCLILPPVVSVLALLQFVPIEPWQALLLGAVMVYAWIYALVLIGWLVAERRRRPAFID